MLNPALDVTSFFRYNFAPIMSQWEQGRKSGYTQLCHALARRLKEDHGILLQPRAAGVGEGRELHAIVDGTTVWEQAQSEVPATLHCLPPPVNDCVYQISCNDGLSLVCFDTGWCSCVVIVCMQGYACNVESLHE